MVGGVIAAVVVGARGRQSAAISSQFERFERLGQALRQYATENEGALPDDLDGVDVPERSLLLTDVATGEPATYRIITASGERIGYNFLGDRIIAWSPQASYRGARAVLLNSADVRFAPDSMIDMPNQRLLGMDTPDMMRPKITLADDDDGDGDDGDDGDEPMDDAEDNRDDADDDPSEADSPTPDLPTSAPATAPGA